MGRPKALKDQIPKVALKATKSAVSHRKFDDEEIINDNQLSNDEELDSKPSTRSRKAKNIEDVDDEDEAPEEVTKEESMSLYNLKQLHEQSILESSSRKKQKRDEKKKLVEKDSIVMKPDSNIDMNVLEDLATKNDVVESDDDYDYDYMDEDETEEGETSNIYGGTRKIGKISVQVLSGSVDVEGDADAQKQAILNSDIFDHFKMSESASEFSKNLITGNNRIKYSTLKSQKMKKSRR